MSVKKPRADEAKIYKLIDEGLTHVLIAERLGIPKSTVATVSRRRKR